MQKKYGRRGATREIFLPPPLRNTRRSPMIYAVRSGMMAKPMLAGGAPIRPWKREDMDREAGSREEDASPGDAGGPGAKVADATRVRAVIRPRVSARRRMVAIRKPPPPPDLP